MRSAADFDKYTAVSMAEAASMEAHRINDPKASFLDSARQTLRAQLDKPTDKFQAYFLALFNDKDYTKVLECIAKVDKTFRSNASATSSNAPSARSPRSSRVACFHCGIPGHVASMCFRRRQQGYQSRFGSGSRFFHTPGHLVLVPARALAKAKVQARDFPYLILLLTFKNCGQFTVTICDI